MTEFNAVRPFVSVFKRYGLAVLLALCALALTLLIQPATLVAPLFFLAILVSAWVGGMGPGLAAASLSTLLIAYFFLPPNYSLAFSRIRSFAKKTSPQNDWIDINQTIGEVIALAGGEIQRNSVTLQMQLSDDTAHARLVFADRIQLQQVILNLIMNAVEAVSESSNGPSQPLLRTGTDDSGSLVVTVRDSGPGLAPENIERLFTPFYTTKPQGMGMGLAICRSIINAHGGTLWATANEERGATFHFTLPTDGPRGDLYDSR